MLLKLCTFTPVTNIEELLSWNIVPITCSASTLDPYLPLPRNILLAEEDLAYLNLT